MIDLEKLREAFYKIAASDKGSDPTADALAGAAAAAKPSWAPPVPDFRKFNKDEEDEDGLNLLQQIDKKDKEIELLKRDKRIVEQNLEFELIKSRQAEALNAIELRERLSLEKLRQEKEKLDQSKVLAEAEEIKHQSKLQQQESDSQLKVLQDKNKALMDLHNQGMKMQMQQADEARSQADKYKEEARKLIEKERQDVYSSYDKERQLMLAQMDKLRQDLEKKHSGMSPALSSVMQGAIKSLSQIGKPKAVKLPKPGSSPVNVSIPQPLNNNFSGPLAPMQHQPEMAPMQSKHSIPRPAATPLLQPPLPQPAQHNDLLQLDKQAAWGTLTKNMETYHESPYKEDAFGCPEILSGILGSVLGPQFAYYRKVSKYDQTRDNDYVFDPAKAIMQYGEHWKDPRWLWMMPRMYRTAPGPYSVKGETVLL